MSEETTKTVEDAGGVGFKPISLMRQAREWAYPQRTTSAFLTKGVLTPEEFVRAGDELVYKCPTWSWERGDPKRVRSYLPDDKQYLVTRGVPCPTRASELVGAVESDGGGNARIEDDNDGGSNDGEEDWVVSRLVSSEEQKKRMEQKLEDEFDILDGDGKVVASAQSSRQGGKSEESSFATDDAHGGDDVGDDEDDEYADMADFEDDNVVIDEADATAVVAGTMKSGKSSSGGVSHLKGDENEDDNLVRVRTYDLSITYDKYYQTPRVWMLGYAPGDSSQPLTGDEMLEDVMEDYANRTVTIENHPHVPGPHASIHPCQHGKVMKTIVRNLIKEVEGEGKEGEEEVEGAEKQAQAPAVEMYLFIFLKFVSSIIPTMNYDFTMDVVASTRK